MAQAAPELEIQPLFGRHDVGGIEAHIGGEAATASRAIGAEAYATGSKVAFATEPSLHTAAHEAAHVVQQRAGVQLLGGVGQEGDVYEQHADAVADLVVQGKFAETALDRSHLAPAQGATRRSTRWYSGRRPRRTTARSSRTTRRSAFETAAVAIDGTQKGTYYGSVSWGLKTDAAGKLSKVDVAKASEAVPTQNFMAAAKLWNTTTARGTLITAAYDTKVYDATLSEKFKLKKDTVLDQQSKSLANDIAYLFVKIDAGAAEHAGETGFVKMSDVKDKGDGKANVKLPYVDVKLTSATTKLYKAKDKKDVVAELAKDTRLKVVSTDGGMQQIEVVDGANVAKTGWIDKGQIKDEG